MVIRPNGYAIWENMQRALDGMFKATGHVNAYFPLFIPMSFLSQGGGARGGLRQGVRRGHAPPPGAAPEGGVRPDPDSELEEPLVVRPTSETIIYAMYAKWIKSYRDLPLLINQWANVVRWEMRTRLFLRTTEFLWQEGHTAHATHEEAWEEVLKMLDVYRRFAEECMAVPVLTGVKTDAEKFAGALKTTLHRGHDAGRQGAPGGHEPRPGPELRQGLRREVPGRDGRAGSTAGRRAGASPRASSAPSSWPTATTRASSSRRSSPPPTRSSCPSTSDEAGKAKVLEVARQLKERLAASGLGVVLDDRDTVSPGFKYNEWELKGVPVRLEIGPRDVEQGVCVAVPRVPTRDLREGEKRQKETLPLDGAPELLKALLDDLQKALFAPRPQVPRGALLHRGRLRAVPGRHREGRLLLGPLVRLRRRARPR